MVKASVFETVYCGFKSYRVLIAGYLIWFNILLKQCQIIEEIINSKAGIS